MIRFIPARYHPTRPWYTTEGSPLTPETAVSAANTITEMRVFQHGDEPIGLVVLNYVPSLRRFMHRQGINGITYWNFFDEVQGLEGDDAEPIDFLAMEWPADAAFFYNPFAVTVMQGEEVYARIYLAPDGMLQRIRFYGSGMPSLERIYDDRGFLSSVLMHDEAGSPATQYYLNRAGDVIISEDVPSGQITVVQNEADRFQQAAYDGWGDLLAELLAQHFAKPENAADTVVLATSEQHNELIRQALTTQSLVLARSSLEASRVSDALLARAMSCFSAEEISDQDPRWEALPHLSMRPLERRSTFGASANEADVIISLFTDNIDLEQLDAIIANLAMQMVDDDRTRVNLLTFRGHDVDRLRDMRRIMDGYQGLDLAALLEDNGSDLAADIGLSQGREPKLKLVTITREADLIQALAATRLLVDFGDRPDQRVAAEAVCAGVPQVNRQPQDLLTDRLNGYLVQSEDQLAEAADYFLDGLEHWNQSLVQCNALIDLFSPTEVLGRWELVKGAMDLAGTADWN